MLDILSWHCDILVSYWFSYRHEIFRWLLNMVCPLCLAWSISFLPTWRNVYTRTIGHEIIILSTFQLQVHSVDSWSDLDTCVNQILCLLSGIFRWRNLSTVLLETELFCLWFWFDHDASPFGEFIAGKSFFWVLFDVGVYYLGLSDCHESTANWRSCDVIVVGKGWFVSFFWVLDVLILRIFTNFHWVLHDRIILITYDNRIE